MVAPFLQKTMGHLKEKRDKKKKEIIIRAICVVGFGPKKSYHISKRCRN